MNDRLPRISPAEAVRVLEKAGFFLARQSGSHRIFKNAEGRRVTVPYHSGKELHPKILKSILRDADLTVNEFQELMK
ncbi:MAG: type II toxin-antitoxin system HicA family toxin [Methanothrix sp.]|nr:type II toxin-antitoxin system HicA family toxin [Methanothrix sp.]MDD4446528.1 type II toxin-antitoxin system HicA family toxin [Methanothrix sp.]